MSLTNLGLITPADIIARLRASTATLFPSLSNRICGAATLDFAEDKTRIPIPCLIVLQSNNTGRRFPSDESDQTGTQEMLTRNFDIVLILDNSDERAQEADTASVAYGQFLIQALVGWSNGGPGFCMAYESDEVFLADKARYIRVFHFSQRVFFDSNNVSLGDLGDLDSLPWLETIRYTLDNLPEEDITLTTTGG